MKKICFLFLLVLFSVNLFADDDEKLKLAVIEFEDLSGQLSPETLSRATEYIRGAFVASNKFIVIAKERQEKAMIKEMKKESYKSCNDKNCQIPLGQALSADTILRTTINFLGGVYSITSELIDLAKEATVVGAKQNFDGTDQVLVLALDKIAEQIAGTVSIRNQEPVIVEENKDVKETVQKNEKEREEQIKAEEEKREAEEQRKAEEERKKAEEKRNAEEEKRSAEEKERKIMEELNQAGRKTKLAVATSTLVAGVVVGALGGVSFYGMNKAKKDHDKYLDLYNKSETTEEILAYRKKTSDADKKYKTYSILGGVGIGVGVALIATSIVFYSIEFKEEKEVKKKYNISFGAQPGNGTFYFALNW